MTDAYTIAQTYNLKHSKDRYTGQCPVCGYKNAFSIKQVGDKPLVYCFAGCRSDEIIAELKRQGLWFPKPGFSNRSPATVATVATPTPRIEFSATQPATGCYSPIISQFASELWAKSLAPQGTLVETYLREHRGIDCKIPKTIRFLPKCRHSPTGEFFPAMVSLISSWQGTPLVALQRTFLNPNTGNKIDNPQCRMILGPVRGHSVHIAEPDDTLGVCEGIESALAVWQITAIPVWAALSWGGICSLVLPPLPKANQILIFADNDPAGLRGAYAAAENWSLQGRKVKVIKPPKVGTDFNDLLVDTQGVKKCL